jgi:hypothetical protein
MSGVAIGLTAVSIGLTAYGAVESSQADKNAAAVDNATAAFNANIDIENAQQLDLDTQQNIDTERQADATYLSREAAGYAASGVLATTGSALRAQITNVGRMTQQIQQQYQNSQIQQQQYYEAAKAGIAEGAAQASADNSAATLALIQGGAQVVGQAYGAYNKGLFSGGTSGGGIAGIFG